MVTRGEKEGGVDRGEGYVERMKKRKHMNLLQR
jgi:hypothetical protein